MSKVQCPYCGNKIEESLENCIFCGAIINGDLAVQNTKLQKEKLTWKQRIFYYVICPLIPFWGILFGLIWSSFEITDGYYVNQNQDVYFLEDEYYHDGKCVWWSYDKVNDEWTHYATYDKKEFPLDVSERSDYCSYSDLEERSGISKNKLEIENSKNYIDAGHHKTPKTSYYYCNGILYYFINDHYVEKEKSVSGWYKYNYDWDRWDYYCDENDKEALGDELWYNDQKYVIEKEMARNFINDEYSNADDTNIYWFENTEWYHIYKFHWDADFNKSEE